MRLVGVGVDSQGRAALLLNFVKAEECEGQLKRPSTLRVGANDVIEHVAGGDKPDASKVTQPDPASYAWSDRDLSLKLDPQKDALFLRFTSAGTSFTVACRPGGTIGTCTKE